MKRFTWSDCSTVTLLMKSSRSSSLADSSARATSIHFQLASRPNTTLPTLPTRTLLPKPESCWINGKLPK